MRTLGPRTIECAEDEATQENAAGGRKTETSEDHLPTRSVTHLHTPKTTKSSLPLCRNRQEMSSFFVGCVVGRKRAR